MKIDWVIQDNMGEKHILNLVYNKNQYSLYIDEKLFSKFKMSRLFNSEYKFEIFGLKCSIIKLMGEKELPKLVVNNKFQHDTNKIYTPIPRPTVFAYVFLVFNLMLFVVSSIYSIVYFDIANVICLFCIFIIADVAIAFVSTAPLVLRHQKYRYVFRIFLTVIITVIHMLFVYGFCK